MLEGLVTAFRTLTIFPVPGREASDYSSALPFFPVVGVSLGLLLWIVSLINNVIAARGWPMGVAALMLVTSVLVTRSLHLDGLADLADAIGGGWDRNTRLQIMKDTHLGVFGAVAIILVLLCKWLAFTRLITSRTTVWVILICMISRSMQVQLAVRLPYARSEGGTASSFVKTATGYQRVAALIITLVAALPFGPFGLVAVAGAETMTLAYGTWCRRTMGGITGDLLGAGNEIIEIALLLLAAVFGPLLPAYTGWGWVLG